MLKIFLFPLLVSLLVTACSQKYQAFTDHYRFTSMDGRPDYSNLYYWAAHPWKKDLSDSIPGPLQPAQPDSLADVFFLHPTTYTGSLKESRLNAPIDDEQINAKTDYSTILYQASIFNQHARVFAPRYRQAHLSAFYTSDTAAANKAFDTAYEDLKQAFSYYLLHYNNGRPIIIAAHSQGSKLAERLLKDFFDNKPLQRQLVVAYIVGWPVTKNYFTSLPVCKDSLQTGCICSWRTFRKGFLPDYVKTENGSALATNPLTWKTDSLYAPRKMNEGSILYKFNKLYKNTTDAQVHQGVLWVKRPVFPWSFLYRTKNYHPGDYNLYYLNVRENVYTRIRSFLNRQPIND
jgi:hypothetical protein